MRLAVDIGISAISSCLSSMTCRLGISSCSSQLTVSWLIAARHWHMLRTSETTPVEQYTATKEAGLQLSAFFNFRTKK